MTQQSSKVTEDKEEINLASAFSQHPLLARVVIFLGLAIMGMIGLILYKLATLDETVGPVTNDPPTVGALTSPAMSDLAELPATLLTAAVPEGAQIEKMAISDRYMLLQVTAPNNDQSWLLIVDLVTGTLRRLDVP